MPRETHGQFYVLLSSDFVKHLLDVGTSTLLVRGELARDTLVDVRASRALRRNPRCASERALQARV